MPKTSFQENMLQKIELKKLAARIIASIGTADQQPRRIDKNSMKNLLEFSPYQHIHERDLDLYVKPDEDEQKTILVLDNELPIFRSTIKDVVTRRSPKTIEMWKIKTIRNILVDSDIRVSTGEDSVRTVLADAVGQLDLSYTQQDIMDLARDGMAWLAGREAEGVAQTLALFAELLDLTKPPKPFGLEQTICYGVAAPGKGKDTVFGPMVIYLPAANSLLWIDKTFSRTDRQQMEFLRTLAAGHASAPVTGDAVFEKLQEKVLELQR